MTFVTNNINRFRLEALRHILGTYSFVIRLISISPKKHLAEFRHV